MSQLPHSLVDCGFSSWLSSALQLQLKVNAQHKYRLLLLQSHINSKIYR